MKITIQYIEPADNGKITSLVISTFCGLYLWLISGIVKEDCPLRVFSQDSMAKCSTVCLSIFRYSPISNTWQKISHLPIARYDSGVYSMGGKIYLVGGYTAGHNAVRFVDEYNPDEDEWAQVSRALLFSFICMKDSGM